MPASELSQVLADGLIAIKSDATSQ
jgi:hypothetical protein